MKRKTNIVLFLLVIILFVLLNLTLFKRVNQIPPAVHACEDKKAGDSCERFIHKKLVYGECRVGHERELFCIPLDKVHNLTAEIMKKRSNN